ncbi:hypothetical protein GOODEAATRI_017808 [Goodea atripinnis]|uniref:NERD domain-containing protein n=1 Tax=Goodea atripinnis TaxID=208336 RepID=A0ABV0NBD1_9TELE
MVLYVTTQFCTENTVYRVVVGLWLKSPLCRMIGRIFYLVIVIAQISIRILRLFWAHRSLAPRPDPSQHLGPLIIKSQNFTDKCHMMEVARRIGSRRQGQKGSAHKNPRISFFNDYSAEVVQRRKTFDGMKARNVDYLLIYPATLWVVVDGKQWRFDSPGEAASFVSSLEQNSDNTIAE